MLKIHTDGACATSRKQGGWAFVIVNDNQKIFSDFNTELNTTNNRMEIQSVIEALTYCRNSNILELELYSDSMYVIGTMSRNWKRNKNTDLWEKLDELAKNLSIHWIHEDGHSGNKWNDYCDMLAVTASNAMIK
jgi:ribonuclease HI